MSSSSVVLAKLLTSQGTIINVVPMNQYEYPNISFNINVDLLQKAYPIQDKNANLYNEMNNGEVKLTINVNPKALELMFNMLCGSINNVDSKIFLDVYILANSYGFELLKSDMEAIVKKNDYTSEDLLNIYQSNKH